MNEAPSHWLETTEQRPRVQYTLKGPFGNVITKGESSDFVIEDLTKHPDASIFDGTLETAVGDFAFEGAILDAKKALANIKRYVEEIANLRTASDSFDPKMKDLREQQMEIMRLNPDNFDGYSDLSSKIRELEEEKIRNTKRIKELETSVQPFKIN